ncbi:hypothetical protein GE09DRAFT_1076213 [Coniochaeta sp. 2T2.1]|nr:hypothetical protein GE09DRAFT_1076213 [Coniochaeta sp. 2T2.1]
MMPDDRPSPVGSPTSLVSASPSPESSQTEHGTGEQNDVPQTPRYRRGRSEPHNAFSPTSSPQLPSSMALNFFRLGIGTSPLSPFRRQFSSNFSNPSVSPSVTREGTAEADDELSERESGNQGPPSDENSGEDDDLTQDSKDVLVDRLNDLLKRLSSGNLGGANITSLHAKVDEMEKVLASDHRKPTRPDRVRQRPSILQLASPLPIVRGDTGPRTPEQQHHPDYWGFTRTPPRRQAGHAVSDVFTDTPDSISKEPSVADSRTEHHDKPDVPKLSSDDADRLVAEAEKLCLELNTVVKNLQDRREESDARPLAPLCQPRSRFHPTNSCCSISMRCSLIEQRLQLRESWS